MMGGYNYVGVRLQRTTHHRFLLPQQSRLPPPSNFKMAKVLQHCNPATTLTVKDEGKVKGNYSLILVIVLTRHGDRAPLRPVRNMSSINCGMKVQKFPLLQKYLRTMESLQRPASSKDPFLAFPLRPSYPRCMPGHMTLAGAHQLLRLGHQLSQVYNGHWKLLSQNWSSEQVVVYSTQYARTYQSALAFLFGFLPRFDFERIRINAAPDTRFCSRQKCRCPQLDTIIRTLEKKQKKLLQSHPAVVHLVRQLDPIVKAHPNDTDATSPFSLFDSLLGYVCHGSHLPCQAYGCVTIDHVRNIIAFLEWQGKQLVDDDTYRKSSWLKIHGLLSGLSSILQDAVDRRKHWKLVLYSGHDLTLSPLASVLGFADGVMPQFASRVIFEVYEHPQSSLRAAEHYLRIVYNGKDVTKYTPIFRSVAQSDTSFCVIIESHTLCPVSHFIEYVRDEFARVFNTTSYQAACAIINDLIDPQFD